MEKSIRGSSIKKCLFESGHQVQLKQGIKSDCLSALYLSPPSPFVQTLCDPREQARTVLLSIICEGLPSRIILEDGSSL